MSIGIRVERDGGFTRFLYLRGLEHHVGLDHLGVLSLERNKIVEPWFILLSLGLPGTLLITKVPFAAERSRKGGSEVDGSTVLDGSAELPNQRLLRNGDSLFRDGYRLTFVISSPQSEFSVHSSNAQSIGLGFAGRDSTQSDGSGVNSDPTPTLKLSVAFWFYHLSISVSEGSRFSIGSGKSDSILIDLPLILPEHASFESRDGSLFVINHRGIGMCTSMEGAISPGESIELLPLRVPVRLLHPEIPIPRVEDSE